VTVLGEKSSAIKVTQLDAEGFNLVASGYDNSNVHFNSLYTKWKRITKRKISLAAWKPYTSLGVTPLQNEMRKMTSRVRDITRAEMDGLLFRTAANQKKFLIDNACVVNQYNVVTLLVFMSAFVFHVCCDAVDFSTLVAFLVLRFIQYSYVLSNILTF